MKHRRVSLILLSLLAPVQAHACRIPPRAAALRNVEADAIVLTMITDVRGGDANWKATGISRGTLMGRAPQRVFSYASEGEVISSCDQPMRPKPDRYWVLYLRRTTDGLRVHRGYPYWWAKASLDPRLARLDRLLPLGAAPSQQQMRDAC